MIVDYVLVVGNMEKLQAEVRERLADGWLPLGAPFKYAEKGYYSEWGEHGLCECHEKRKGS